LQALVVMHGLNYVMHGLQGTIEHVLAKADTPVRELLLRDGFKMAGEGSLRSLHANMADMTDRIETMKNDLVQGERTFKLRIIKVTCWLALAGTLVSTRPYSVIEFAAVLAVFAVWSCAVWPWLPWLGCKGWQSSNSPERAAPKVRHRTYKCCIHTHVRFTLIPGAQL
jgi:hypothetical protein